MMPSLRMDQSDLKCKNGCDYFGNPQWQGYCSKCHREQAQRQRRAEKASSLASAAGNSATLPKPEQKRSQERSAGLTSYSSFSKFELKRQRQSDTLKKANLLKFSVFKKSNTEEQEPQERRPPEFKIPSSVNENMKREWRAQFHSLPSQADRDARVFVHSLIMDVIKCADLMTTDELSERVHRQYSRWQKHMDSSPHFSDVDGDTKELIMDFVEKHAMSYLHELPSVVFSPAGTDDERLDRALSDRIQQLSWVGETHLECRLDKGDPRSRQLLYRAISELLGMDSAPSPGGKLSRVRRCCRHVLALCGTAASADDLLPALIFTVLKANPPRLISNVNFVTRFSNSQRLMTGEGGYYFTNLCCALSFIENLNAESLNMDKKEFDCYMAMPASIGGSSWACALSLCGATREVQEQRALAQRLLDETRAVSDRAHALASDAISFEEQIAKKVQDVLAKTPLEIKPRRQLPRFGDFSNVTPLIDLETNTSPATAEQEPIAPPISQITEPVVDIEAKAQETDVVDSTKEEQEEKLSILGFEPVENPSPAKSLPYFDQSWHVKQSNSMELLTPSSLGFPPFDSRSVDELMTPDDFGSEHLVPGLSISNINYDIDLSDLSGDNSMAEDPPKERALNFSPVQQHESKDPFSPEGLNKDGFLHASTSKDLSAVLEPFDQFSLVDPETNATSEPFQLVPRDDLFSPQDSGDFFPQPPKEPVRPIQEADILKPLISQISYDPFSPEQKDLPSTTQGFKNTDRSLGMVDTLSSMEKDSLSSILDDSPTAACLLPSPLLPQSSKPA